MNLTKAILLSVATWASPALAGQQGVVDPPGLPAAAADMGGVTAPADVSIVPMQAPVRLNPRLGARIGARINEPIGRLVDVRRLGGGADTPSPEAIGIDRRDTFERRSTSISNGNSR